MDTRSGDSALTEVVFLDDSDAVEGLTWEDAYKWQDAANIGKEDYKQAVWSFDCGLKLDFDGPLASISSRFYPPTKHYGAGWDGKISVMIMDHVIGEYEITADSLDELKSKAEGAEAELRLMVVKRLENLIPKAVSR